MPVRVEAGSEVIPGYKLIDRLGGGGFGEVWKCEAPGGLLKAIKIVYGDLNTTDPDGTKRTEQELKALKRVQSVRHPYLLSLERYDIIEGRLLITMELADRNLWDRFRECRTQNLLGIPRDELLRYMDETAEVLDLMNTQHALQHLDIKPQNLFLVHNHAKVADFGLVKDLEGMMATVTGGITPVYAAPETFDGKVSRYCDQYSLAIVYQELLTGQRPFSGTSLQQLIMQHLSAQPNLAPLPRPDRGPIARSLSKKPEARYASCTDLINALRKAGEASPRSSAVIPTPLAPTPLHETPVADEDATAANEIDLGAPAHPAHVQSPAAGLRAEPTPPRAPQTQVEEPPAQEPEFVALRQAPPHQAGEGILFPSVVIGLGQKGMEALQVFQTSLRNQFGSLAALPHLKLIYIDTDPETAQAAARTSPETVIGAAETVQARLNRAAHYLKAGSGRSPYEAWLNAKLIYRIPRVPVTSGMRCLGRLAFVDHYKTIAGKIRTDLEACIKPDALSAANRHTRLGLRSNYPRVYIVTSLTGGTGSGMFIDAAYVARTQLRLLGYAEPDVVGVFLLPTPETMRSNVVALGNACAAMTELKYFSHPATTFSFKFDEREPRVKDAAAPFSRAVLFPLEPETAKDRAGESTRLIGDFLYRDLLAPLGRMADSCRPQIEPGGEGPAPTKLQAVGLFRFTWPRRVLVHHTARQVCGKLVQRWLVKDAAANMREHIKNWLIKELTRLEMDADHLISHLQDACEKELGQSPEAWFAEQVDALVPQSKRDPDPSSRQIQETLNRLEELVGSSLGDAPGSKRKEALLAGYMDRTGEALARRWGGKLTQMVLRLVEDPSYRIRGAEEANRQLSKILEDTLKTYEPVLRELEESAAELRQQIDAHLDVLRANPGGGRRTAQTVADLIEALRAYPRTRYQALFVRRMVNVYTTLRGMSADQIRELTFCRQRLGELAKSLEQTTSSAGAAERIVGAYLLPAGSQSVQEAVEMLLEDVAPEELHHLDQQVQSMIGQQFTSLAQVCLASGNAVRTMEDAMQNLAEAFVASKLTDLNIVEMFLSQYEEEPDAANDAIVNAYQDAVPELARKVNCSEPEIRIVAAPPGEGAEGFRNIVRRALPNMQIVFTESPDDLVIYREQPDVPIEGLEVLGKLGQDAYKHMSGNENFHPHCREDITDWQPEDQRDA